MATGEQRCVRCCEVLTRKSSALNWGTGSTISEINMNGHRILQQVAFVSVSIDGMPDCTPVDPCPRETEVPSEYSDCYPNNCVGVRWALDRRELER